MYVCVCMSAPSTQTIFILGLFPLIASILLSAVSCTTFIYVIM